MEIRKFLHPFGEVNQDTFNNYTSAESILTRSEIPIETETTHGALFNEKNVHDLTEEKAPSDSSVSNEDDTPLEDRKDFPRWRKRLLKVGIGITTFGIIAVLSPIPFGWLITPIGFSVMSIAVGPRRAQWHVNNIFSKIKKLITKKETEKATA